MTGINQERIVRMKFTYESSPRSPLRSPLVTRQLEHASGAALTDIETMSGRIHRSPFGNVMRLLALLTAGMMLVAGASAAGLPASVAVDQIVTRDLPDPKGSDPLGPQEIARAKALAERSQRVQRARSRGGAFERPRSLQRLERVQFLFAERSQTGKSTENSGRRADVFFYDYSSDEIIRQVVDLRAGEAVETTRTAVEQQPPVTSNEARAGIQLVLDHPQLGPTLRTLYRQLSGQDITGPEQLHVQAGIYTPRNGPGTPLASAASACDRHRCVYYLVPYDDGRYIDASNMVVDLSAGQVIWVDQGLTVHIDAAISDETSENSAQPLR